MRLWPWAWPQLGAIAPADLAGRWMPWDAPPFATIEARLAAATDLNAIGAALIAATCN